MRTNRKIWTVCLSSMLISAVSYAQFTLSGEIRPRSEYRHGYKTLSDSAMVPAIFIDQRTRLNFGYKSEYFNTFIQLQDVRVWGSQKQLVGNEDFGMSIHQAWAEAIVSSKVKLKFGRQELAYDDHRILGNVGWAQQARSHDAAVLIYQDSSFAFHLGGAYNQDAAKLSGNQAFNGGYKSMQYLWMHKEISKLRISGLFLNNGLQASKIDNYGIPKYWINYSQTIGTRATFKSDKLFFGFNGYYQTGLTSAVPNKKISAYLLGIDLSYKVTNQLLVQLGFENQSGNSQTDTTAKYLAVNHAFAPLYGTNHKFNGYIDYFYVGNHAASVGLRDIYLKLKYTHDKFYLGADLHYFMSAANVWDTPGYTDQIAAGNLSPTIQTMNPYLGAELDLSFGFNLSKGVALKGGYSQMIGSETMAVLKESFDSVGDTYTNAFSNWAYVMIIAKPTFLDTGKSKK
ncbi:alginate export family protein [Flavobacteriales bacterium]|nr:alginate export family protein [Flavobacteriales bacterium]